MPGTEKSVKLRIRGLSKNEGLPLFFRPREQSEQKTILKLLNISVRCLKVASVFARDFSFYSPISRKSSLRIVIAASNKFTDIPAMDDSVRESLESHFFSHF